MAPAGMGGPQLAAVDAGRDPGGVDAEDIGDLAGTQTRFSHPMSILLQVRDRSTLG